MAVTIREASNREVVVEVSAHAGVATGILLVAFGYFILSYLPSDADPLKLWIARFVLLAGIVRLAISRYGTIRLSLDEDIVEFRLRWLCGLSKNLKHRLSQIVEAKVETSHYSSTVGRSPRRVSLVKGTGEVLPLTSYFDAGRKNNAGIVDAIEELLKSVARKRKRAEDSREA